MGGMVPAGSDVPFAPYRSGSALPKMEGDRSSAEPLPTSRNLLSARSGLP
jgi:hypothetical protein